VLLVFPLSLLSIPQSYKRWSVVWSPWVHTRSGVLHLNFSTPCM
jgi:hypothetical protein